MSKEQKRDELTEIIIKASEDWLKKFGRMNLHLEHKAEHIAGAVASAGYRKQKTARWIIEPSWDPRAEDSVRCSNCGNDVGGPTRYCSSCGSRMNGRK